MCVCVCECVCEVKYMYSSSNILLHALCSSMLIIMHDRTMYIYTSIKNNYKKLKGK